MKIRNTALLLFSVLAAAGILASCGDTAETASVQTSADTETAEEETTEDLLKPDLPEDLDYSGYTFRIFSRYEAPNSMVSDEATGDTMDDAVYMRNLAVSEQLNIQFESVCTDDNLWGTDAKEAIMAGEDAYDLVIPHARFLFSTYALNGLCLDWYDLTYVDLDKPYWYQDAKESFTVSGRLFGMMGDIDYDALSRTKCMFFNKKTADDYDLESIYDLVTDGKWTLDKFSEMVRSVKSDLNGDGKISIEEDQIGYATNWWGGPINVLYAGNQRVCEINEDGEIILTINTPKTVALYDKYFALFDTDDCFLRGDTGVDLAAAFRDSRVFIEDGMLLEAEDYRDMEVDFGIVPWPKYDESETEYRTGVDAGCNMLLVPVTATDIDRTSAILELMCYEGNKTVIPAYYDIVLESKSSRDDESAAMIDLIRKSGLFDIGYYCYDDINFLGSCGRILSERPGHNFASYYAECEAYSESVIKKINKTFASIE